MYECAEQRRCREMAEASNFYRAVYSEESKILWVLNAYSKDQKKTPEIEEVGWEHLVRFGGDLTSLSFRILDGKGRMHIIEIQLDKTHPKCPPSISADVPYMFDLKWSTHSRLKDVVQQFKKHLEKLQAFWSTLDDIDRSLWVVDPKQASPAVSYRQINMGNDCFIVLSINAFDPRSLPEINDKQFLENLKCLLETQLPISPDVQKNEQQVECGICYAQSLPIDEELRHKSGTGTDYTCDNTSCKRAFHSICLVDWLRSITTTRQSFDVLFGSCPYCSEPVAVDHQVAPLWNAANHVLLRYICTILLVVVLIHATSTNQPSQRRCAIPNKLFNPSIINYHRMAPHLNAHYRSGWDLGSLRSFQMDISGLFIVVSVSDSASNGPMVGVTCFGVMRACNN
ncbi:zinc ion-binding protein [Prunus dulcis]|uniref:Zinc ion-binding protein n=1 Tax=Prunus dulcis TaxID=3755 RepID=A0A4Y1RNE2_PRUDU|nr:zinc ion-binding protein [Prunus dulcis]